MGCIARAHTDRSITAAPLGALHYPTVPILPHRQVEIEDPVLVLVAAGLFRRDQQRIAQERAAEDRAVPARHQELRGVDEEDRELVLAGPVLDDRVVLLR